MTENREGALYARRSMLGVNLVLLLLGVLVIVVSVNIIAAAPVARFTVDATRTRAYSLSRQTQTLLGGLEGEWTLALVLDEQQIDAAILRQVDEVIDRLRDGAPKLTVLRLGGSDPATLGAFETLVAHLELIYSDEVIAYTRALDAGEGALKDLLVFAQQTALGLDRLLAAMPETVERDRLRDHALELARLAAQGDAITQSITAMRTVSDTRAIPDYDGARSTLASVLTRQSSALSEMAGTFERWRQRVDLDPALRQYATNATERYRALAQSLLTAADPLRRLEPLALSGIGEALQNKQSAVIIGPDRAVVIPAEQLFPIGVIDQQADTVHVDQRFRGEQIIAAAIRSLTVEHMPLVVFVHAEESSLLARRDQAGSDLTAMASALRASRFEVAEWMVTQGEQPQAAEGQPVVYVVIPPSFARSARGMAPEEIALINATEALLGSGESVLLSAGPSLLTAIGQTNPWERITGVFGRKFDSGSVIVRGSPGEGRVNLLGFQTKQGAAVYGLPFQQFAADHPIAGALNGLQLFLPLPIAVITTDDAAPNADSTSIVDVQPGPRTWRDDLQSIARGRVSVPEDHLLSSAVAVVVAATRSSTVSDGSRQRLLLVGSGTWMYSVVADEHISLGGDRSARLNPGNIELMLASAAWLAGMDELIAPSPLSRQVARISGLEPDERRKWLWMLRAGMPLACLLLGAVVWAWRRWI